MKKRPETQNRSTIQIVTTKYVSAPAQCHARHPQHHQTPPRAAGLTRARTGMHPLQQGPSRQGWQTELQQHAALQWQAARRQPAGRSGQPFRTPTAANRSKILGPATDRFEPKNAFRTKQIRDFAWPVPQTDGEVRQGPKIGANSIARRSNLLKLGRFEPCNFALWRNG